MAKHGTTYSYDVKKCRCEECKAASAAKRKRFNDSRIEIRHGTTFGYNEQKCRCGLCREAKSEAQTRYRKENPQKRIEERSRENPEKARDRYLRYYQEHPDRVKEANRVWAGRNPEKVSRISRAVCHRRRARKRNAEGCHTDADILAILEFQQGYCRYCDCEVYSDYHVDHVMPLSLGGGDGPENLVISCPSCNHVKNAMHPDEWIERLKHGNCTHSQR